MFYMEVVVLFRKTSQSSQQSCRHWLLRRRRVASFVITFQLSGHKSCGLMTALLMSLKMWEKECFNYLLPYVRTTRENSRSFPQNVSPCVWVNAEVRPCTMLQKLSKCEVKAWLCWHLIILPPLRSYVKSNDEFIRSKNVIFRSFRSSQFSF